MERETGKVVVSERRVDYCIVRNQTNDDLLPLSRALRVPLYGCQMSYHPRNEYLYSLLLTRVISNRTTEDSEYSVFGRVGLLLGFGHPRQINVYLQVDVIHDTVLIQPVNRTELLNTLSP